MSDPNIQVLRKETYLKAIENSIGSNLFNSLLVRFKDSGKTQDILNDGEFSCAFFVSSLLYLFQSIGKPHATVVNVLKALDSDANWHKVSADDIQAGDVIFWEKMKFDDGSENAHIGFAISKTEAVSSDYRQKTVSRLPIIREETGSNIDAVFRYTWPDLSENAQSTVPL